MQTGLLAHRARLTPRACPGDVYAVADGSRLHVDVVELHATSQREDISVLTSPYGSTLCAALKVDLKRAGSLKK